MALLLARAAVLAASAGVAFSLHTQRQPPESNQDPDASDREAPTYADDPDFNGEYFPLYPPPQIPPGSPATPAHDAPRPNILYFIADDLGWGDVGYHNSEAITPNIDALAAEGVRLESFYSQGSSAPTRASILTGRYPLRYGYQHHGYALSSGSVMAVPLAEKLLPERLKEAGYTTHLVGKWDLGAATREHLPHFRGFDTHFGQYGQGVTYKGHKDIRGSIDLHFGVKGRDAQCMQDLGTFDAVTLYTTKAMQVIDYHKPQNGPLFLCFAYHSVHGPSLAAGGFLQMYPKTKQPRRTKLAMVSALDQALGKVVERWRTAHGEAFWKNSIVIFHSDNGGVTGGPDSDGLNFPLRGGRFSLYEGGLRVNAFVLSPLIERPGRIEHGLVHVTDMLPVLVDRLGGLSLSGGKPLDGIDVWDTISRGDESPRTEIVHGADYMGNDHFGPTGPKIRGCATGGRMQVPGTCELSGAFRQGKWKLIAGMYARCHTLGSKFIAQCGYRLYNGSKFEAGNGAEPDDDAGSDAAGPDLGGPGDGAPASVDEPGGQEPPAEADPGDSDAEVPVVLFDLEADPYETTDLSSDQADIVSLMRQRLTDVRTGEWMDPQFPPYKHCETPGGSCEMQFQRYQAGVRRRGCVDYLFEADFGSDTPGDASYPPDWEDLQLSPDFD